MTLKEKFFNWYPKQDAEFISEECEKIADEFAIGFTDWCEDFYYPSSDKGIWYDKPDFSVAKKFTTIELLEIYKEQKQLC